MRRLALSLFVMALAVLLSGCGGSSKTATKPDSAKGATTVSFCAQGGTSVVVCTLPSGSDAGTQDLSSVLSDAQSLNSSVTSSTPMVITAFGGPGAGLQSDETGAGGHSGQAQTVTTLSSYEANYGTTDLYYYLGSAGSTNYAAMTGGAATIVASADLQTTEPCISTYGNENGGSCSSSNILLIAGGGGGGGGTGFACDGGYGGDGGTALATTSTAVTGSGANGKGEDIAGCSGGRQGQGGGDGSGGSGGDGGGGIDAHAGGSGHNGIGGAGGPSHTKKGEGTPIYWLNATSGITTIGESGQGGEGEYRGGDISTPGGAGGGGFGGGGAGGSGGETFPGAGGGGGGSWATGSTTSASYTPTNSSGEATVMVSFVVS